MNLCCNKAINEANEIERQLGDLNLQFQNASTTSQRLILSARIAQMTEQLRLLCEQAERIQPQLVAAGHTNLRPIPDWQAQANTPGFNYREDRAIQNTVNNLPLFSHSGGKIVAIDPNHNPFRLSNSEMLLGSTNNSGTPLLRNVTDMARGAGFNFLSTLGEASLVARINSSGGIRFELTPIGPNLSVQDYFNDWHRIGRENTEFNLAAIANFMFGGGANNTNVKTKVPGASAQSGVSGNARFPVDSSQIKHIFGNRKGHIADTPANRTLLTDTANPANFKGLDMYGNRVYTKTLSNGSQSWVTVRNGIIQNGGVNLPGAVRTLVNGRLI